MKQIVAGLVVALAAVVLFAGCGKKEEPPPTVPPGVEVPPIPPPLPTEAKPAPAPAPVTAAPIKDLAAGARSVVEQAMSLAKEGKYQEALLLLQQKSAEFQGNAEGKSLIENAIAQIKQMMADAAAKSATDKVGGAVGKALGGFAK
ncbi:MAG: hypothetical protein FJ395_15035 [Verrucomicrobia bacterium]|nr:hypothetical protein [Verrucomicrobiota bacterium]